MDISLIGSQIQRFRKERGLTQRELGAAIGVSTQAVSQWENGGAPDAALLPAIADRLGVTVDALFGREGGEVRDMSDIFIQWLRSLPEKERLGRIARLLWEASIYGVSDVLFTAPRIDYPEKAEVDMLSIAESRVLMRTVTGIDCGYILGVGAEDYSFFGVFPEPEAGYESISRPTTNAARCSGHWRCPEPWRRCGSFAGTSSPFTRRRSSPSARGCPCRRRSGRWRR